MTPEMDRQRIARSGSDSQDAHRDKPRGDFGVLDAYIGFGYGIGAATGPNQGDSSQESGGAHPARPRHNLTRTDLRPFRSGSESSTIHMAAPAAKAAPVEPIHSHFRPLVPPG